MSEPLNLYIATSQPGLSYVIKQCCAEPLSFIAYVKAPPLPEAPLNMQACDLAEAFGYVGRHLFHTRLTVARIIGSVFTSITDLEP